MSLKLYNTMTRRVEEFAPLSPPTVRLYTCGPTVYNYAHIGNLRTYVFEDVLKRALQWCGFEVRHVMNVTDVGHLVSDADEGEDKMALGAQREGKTVWEIAQFYWDAFRADLRRLNILEPDVWCRATDHIAEQIAQVRALEEKGYTYVVEGDGVYFDTSRLPDYGKLARLDIAGLQAGARIELAAGKRNATDFALWKFSPPDKKRLMEWPSPWGVGFPGWHIECSAMAVKYLGDRLDIHCGGIDHVPVHHTNEIAQAECALGHEWCRWWMHGEFLTMPKAGNETARMSKSSGEFLKLDLLVEKGYDPLAYRYFCLNAHYRQQLAFTWESLDAAANAWDRLRWEAIQHRWLHEDQNLPLHEEYLVKFRQAVEDDLNMPRALASVWSMMGDKSIDRARVYATLHNMDEVLGFGLDTMKAVRKGGNYGNDLNRITGFWADAVSRNDTKLRNKIEAEIPKDVTLEKTDAGAIWQHVDMQVNTAEIDRLITERTAAKKAKNFARADEIRNRLQADGIELMDTPQGTTWRRA
ncbi:MAG TPA: cysteine--tRNA ligase [Phycisphaerales bacterium]|nr:cysteine--tRNA ligase [Phycisphaerales bacterium]